MSDRYSPMKRFVKPSGGSGEADSLLCRHLRTKTWLSPDAFGQGDPRESPSIAQYWCLKTMRPDGPDGDLVLPESCTDERTCFEAAVHRGGES